MRQVPDRLVESFAAHSVPRGQNLSSLLCTTVQKTACLGKTDEKEGDSSTARLICQPVDSGTVDSEIREIREMKKS